MDESLTPREIPAGGEGTCRLEFSDIGVGLRYEEGRCGGDGEREEGRGSGCNLYVLPTAENIWVELGGGPSEIYASRIILFLSFFIIISASLRHLFHFKMTVPQAGHATCTAPEGWFRALIVVEQR